MFEKLGLPTVSVVSDAFEEMFLSEARQKGMPDLPYVVVPHPLGGVRPPEVREKAAQAVPAVIDALRPRPSP